MSMRLRYDEDLVEAAVLQCASGRRPGVTSQQMARFNLERERLYTLLDPDERDTAFFRLHLEWFREWGLELLLIGPLKEFPLLGGALKTLAFRKSRVKSDEGAELYVNESGDRNGVVAIRPERLQRDGELSSFLRHELMHLHDMVDPMFGYLPELAVAGPFLSQRHLARERYRLLWDVTIDGRLSQGGHGNIADRDQRWCEFAGAFTFWTATRQREVFELLWTSPRPAHRMLEELACDPRHQAVAAGPRPGAPCPLCGFPTFAWAAEARLTAQASKAIRTEFPRWMPHHGVCARCCEIYRVNSVQVPTSI